MAEDKYTIRHEIVDKTGEKKIPVGDRPSAKAKDYEISPEEKAKLDKAIARDFARREYKKAGLAQLRAEKAATAAAEETVALGRAKRAPRPPHPSFVEGGVPPLHQAPPPVDMRRIPLLDRLAARGEGRRAGMRERVSAWFEGRPPMPGKVSDIAMGRSVAATGARLAGGGVGGAGGGGAGLGGAGASLGPAAAGLAGLAGAAVAATAALGALASSALVKELAEYSPTVAGALGQAEIRGVESRLEAAEVAGPELAKFIAAQAELSDAWRDIKANTAKLAGPLAVVFIKLLEGVLRILNLILGGIIKIFEGIAKTINDTINALANKGGLVFGWIKDIRDMISNWLFKQEKAGMVDFEKFFDPDFVSDLAGDDKGGVSKEYTPFSWGSKKKLFEVNKD